MRTWLYDNAQSTKEFCKNAQFHTFNEYFAKILKFMILQIVICTILKTFLDQTHRGGGGNRYAYVKT